ncbi:MAG: aminotransferase class V-fold PLP-dependent enzyme [Chloroflexota bacterium]|nr:aminotransferase class V-fold PLP-dependent enzyme [Chloroflexota bacterium]
MMDLTPPRLLDDHPDTSREALQALAPGFVYCNVAGSGPTFPIAQRAAERARAWLSEVGMFSHVGYDAYNAWLADARADIAALLGDAGGASRIALMTSATEGLNTMALGLRLPPGSLIATTAEEHGSALMPLHRRRERGDRLRIVRHETDAQLLGDLRRAFADGARALVMSLVSCKSGNVLPVGEACALARAAGAVSVVDAAQALGQIPVDVRALGADAVVTLGHKWLHGPLATGAVWVRDVELFSSERIGWRSQSTFDVDAGYTLQPDATRFEAGTIDAAAFVGLRQAIAVHRAFGDAVPRRIAALRGRLLERVARLGVPLRSRPAEPTGIVVLLPEGGDAAGIVTRMWTADRVVVKHLAEKGVVADGIRVSFWALHTDDDIDRVAASLAARLAVAA